MKEDFICYQGKKAFSLEDSFFHECVSTSFISRNVYSPECEPLACVLLENFYGCCTEPDSC